jgi:hypothetical protein
MPLITKKFLDACRGCTYDTANKCLITPVLAGSANAFLNVINDEWALMRGGIGMPIMNQETADKLVASDSVSVGNDSFSTGGVIYSLVVDPSEQAKATEAS